MFKMCPVGSVGIFTRNSFFMTPVAFPATLPSYGLLIQLWGGGMVGDRSAVFFFFPFFQNTNFNPSSIFPFFWKVASYQSLMFWVKVWWPRALQWLREESGQNGQAERINSGALTLAGISFQRGRPLVLISHCTGFILGTLVTILAVVCMLF